MATYRWIFQDDVLSLENYACRMGNNGLLWVPVVMGDMALRNIMGTVEITWPSMAMHIIP
jgi:hypothetical protein